MGVWTVFLGLLVMFPWLELLSMLGLKYLFNKPVQHQWRIFLFTLVVSYLLVLIIALIVFVGGPVWFKK